MTITDKALGQLREAYDEYAASDRDDTLFRLNMSSFLGARTGALLDEIERLRVLADANRQRGKEIANLRVVVEHYSMEPCQYVEEGRCIDPDQSLALEEFCGPCSARHVLSDPA